MSPSAHRYGSRLHALEIRPTWSVSQCLGLVGALCWWGPEARAPCPPLKSGPVRGGSLERERQMRVGSLKISIFALTFEHFTYMATRLLSGDTTVNNLGDISRSFIRLFHIKFLINGVWYGKSYYRQLIGNHTLALDLCHLMTYKHIWRSFQPRLSYPCPFKQSLACFRVARSPSNSWASCLL